MKESSMICIKSHIRLLIAKLLLSIVIRLVPSSSHNEAKNLPLYCGTHRCLNNSIYAEPILCHNCNATLARDQFQRHMDVYHVVHWMEWAHLNPRAKSVCRHCAWAKMNSSRMECTSLKTNYVMWGNFSAPQWRNCAHSSHQFVLQITRFLFSGLTIGASYAPCLDPAVETSHFLFGRAHLPQLIQDSR